MIQCPYCGGKIERKPEYIPMSRRKRLIYDVISQAGPEGIPLEELRKKFFNGRAAVTLRTTIHNINLVIRPIRIDCRGGVVRIIPKEG